MGTDRDDIYTRVTDRIIEAIGAGAKGGRMPWHVTDAERFSPMNAVSHKPYRGVNVLTLWAVAEEHEYPTGLWRRFFARGYSVFNAAQVDGFTSPAFPKLPETERIAGAERFLGALGADVRHEGSRA